MRKQSSGRTTVPKSRIGSTQKCGIGPRAPDKHKTALSWMAYDLEGLADEARQLMLGISTEQSLTLYY